MAGEDVNRLRAARDLAAIIRLSFDYTSAEVAAMSQAWRTSIAADIERPAPSERTWAVVVELLSWSEQVAKAGS